MASLLKSPTTTIFKTVAVFASILFVFSFTNQPSCVQTDIFQITTSKTSLPLSPSYNTNISHLVFGVVASIQGWRHRKPYIDSWWRPNVTRGYLYLDTYPTDDFLPWSQASPPFRISDNITNLLEETKHVAPIMVRIVHAILEIFREEKEGVRWYIMGDDDSIFFVDNMVDVLTKYDHTKYIYIGGHSENVATNQIFSYDMGFGGGGLIMSYPLVKMVQKNLEDCLRKYPYLTSADIMTIVCVNDFGVSMTAHQGLHQLDLHGDASGFLSAHPKAPLLSLHHLDHVDPIFPPKDRFESLKLLMKAADVDQSRLVQQTICYNRELSWSFSLSWGYSVHIYENVIPRSILKVPLETFTPWFWDAKPPFYIFNTRPLTNDPCAAPHVFSLKSAKKINENEVVTKYVRVVSRGLPTCQLGGNHSADSVTRIVVVSPVTKPNQNGKTECCDVLKSNGTKVAKLKLRDCMEDELIA